MNTKHIAFSMLSAAIAFTLVGCGDSEPESFPSEDIELIVPWGAGGDTDVVYRVTNKYLSEELGTNIFITNVAGGGGAIGAYDALNADTDGYTLLAGHDSIAITYLMGQTDFEYFDFEPVALMSSTNQFIATNADNPWDNMEELIEDARENPGEISFGATQGSTTHMVPLGIMSETGVDFNFVNYEDTADRTQALLGNHVDVVPTTLPAAQDYYEAGEIKFLGYLGEERNEAVPDVATLKEQDIDFTFGTNRGYFYPEGTPDEIVETLNEALENVAENPDFQNEIENLGVELNFLETEEYEEYLEQDLERFSDILDEHGILEER